MAKNTVMEELQQILKDLAKGHEKLLKAQQKTQEAQQKTEEAQQKTEEAQQKTEEAQQKTEEAQQKTEKGLMELRESSRKMQAAIEETQKTVREQGENFDRTNGSIRELRESIEKQGENLDKANGGFKDKWGSFVENLVKGTLVSLLKSKGIAVTRLIPNYEVNDENLQPIAEFDLIATNGDEMVVVEVKSTLTNDKVDAFVRKIEEFDKSGFPTYQEGKKIYGAMAYMEIYERTKRAKKRKQVAGEDSAKRAARKGLLLIEAPGGDGGTMDGSDAVFPVGSAGAGCGGKEDFAKIANPEGFEPREF